MNQRFPRNPWYWIIIKAKVKIKSKDITGYVILLFVAVFFGYNQYWPDGFMGFMSKSTRLLAQSIGPLSAR